MFACSTVGHEADQGIEMHVAFPVGGTARTERAVRVVPYHEGRRGRALGGAAWGGGGYAAGSQCVPRDSAPERRFVVDGVLLRKIEPALSGPRARIASPALRRFALTYAGARDAV